MDKFIFDACSFIALIENEEGADKVESIIERTEKNECLAFIHKINLLEVYYGIYREVNKLKADKEINKIKESPVKIIDKISDKVFKEAGRLKVKYKISIADSIALAEAKTRKAKIVTSDHHEFDIIEQKEKIDFYWIR